MNCNIIYLLKDSWKLFYKNYRFTHYQSKPFFRYLFNRSKRIIIYHKRLIFYWIYYLCIYDLLRQSFILYNHRFWFLWYVMKNTKLCRWLTSEIKKYPSIEAKLQLICLQKKKNSSLRSNDIKILYCGWLLS